MENLKLISLRVDPLVIRRVTSFVEKHHYWKKSSVMANLLLMLFKCTSDYTLFRMLSDMLENPSQFEIQIIKKVA